MWITIIVTLINVIFKMLMVEVFLSTFFPNVVQKNS